MKKTPSRLTTEFIHLTHPYTEIYTNVMAQGREPVVVGLNRGLENYNYPIPNHFATFERRPESFQYNYYISNYFGTDLQVKNFDASANTSIPYYDLFGNSQTNIGPKVLFEPIIGLGTSYQFIRAAQTEAERRLPSAKIKSKISRFE